jgi:hypothetical protein
MTPEGLNERLTFLLQCTRPGDTIPTKQPGGNLVDTDARNTAFGAPPICILRVGDFYHSKVVIDSCNFSYEDGKFDLNPEGIGVQPMIVTVQMGFKFIGGQGLKGPIDELQNALSFNFFGNTEMYDERATDSLQVSGYNKEFIEKTEPTGDTSKNTNSNYQNEGGTTIGSVEGKFQDSGTSVNVAYKNLVNNFIESFNNFTQGEYDKLKQVSEQYNSGILKLFTKERDYKSGLISSTGVTIFGKSTSVVKSSSDNLIDKLFEGLLSDINSGSLSIQKDISNAGNNVLQQNVLKTRLIELTNEAKATFTNNLNAANTDLTNAELKMARNIDKLNYIVNSVDGYIDTKGVPQIYTNNSADTVTNINTVMSTYATLINNFNSDLEKNGIIAISADTIYNNEQTYNLPGGSFSGNSSDKRFFLVFGFQLTNNYSDFESKLLQPFTTEKIKKDIKESLLKKYKSPADKEKKEISNIFSTFNKNYIKGKKYIPGDYKKYLQDKRNAGLSLNTSPTEQNIKKLKDLYTGQNSDPNKDTFNGKVTF